jgi:hypothetical protein
MSEIEVQAELDRVRMELAATKQALDSLQQRDTDRPPPSSEHPTASSRIDSVAHYVALMDSLVSEVQGFRLDLQKIPDQVEKSVAAGLVNSTVEIVTRLERAEAEIVKLKRWRDDFGSDGCGFEGCPRRAASG